MKTEKKIAKLEKRLDKLANCVGELLDAVEVQGGDIIIAESAIDLVMHRLYALDADLNEVETTARAEANGIADRITAVSRMAGTAWADADYAVKKTTAAYDKLAKTIAKQAAIEGRVRKLEHRNDYEQDGKCTYVAVETTSADDDVLDPDEAAWLAAHAEKEGLKVAADNEAEKRWQDHAEMEAAIESLLNNLFTDLFKKLIAAQAELADYYAGASFEDAEDAEASK